MHLLKLICFVASLTSYCFCEEDFSGQTVFVTGGAGFIGYHTAVQLHNKNAKVVVLDNFNDYYDVTLKKSRAEQLHKLGVTVHEGDLCDQPLVEELFKKYHFQLVVHMAAQAGVTYSLKDPLSYVYANTQCLVTLLDVLKDHKAHLVYASSSSVYGRTKDIPFSPKNPLAPPSNMYAALKMAGEEMVAAYCNTYDMSVVGVRPFTVYGPWGRPDMAVYGMAVEITEGTTVMIRQVDGKSASRDFTYVEDLVGGVLQALKYQPKSCSEVYNLGRGQPISVDQLVELLEENLGKQAYKEYVPLPSYELPITHADITTTTDTLGYMPTTSVEEGIRKFVEWFKSYHVNGIDKSDKDPDHSLRDKVKKEHFDDRNKAYLKRIGDLREKYEKYAIDHHIPVAHFYRNKTFKEIKDKDVGGKSGRVMGGKSLKELESMCKVIDECVAYTKEGKLLVTIKPQSGWTDRQGGQVFIADIDVCKSGIHECFGNSTCESLGPAQYKCGCKEGHGLVDPNHCIELYKPGHESQQEKEEKLADNIDGTDWEKLKGKSEFARFSNTDSGGNDLVYYPDAKGDVEKLKAACDASYHCVAFNTKGQLKKQVIDPSKWSKSTGDLYVRDFDYCSLNPIGCSKGKKCKRISSGKYGCG